MRFSIYIVGCIYLFQSMLSYGGAELIAENGSLSLQNHLEYFVDSDGSFAIRDLILSENDGRFFPVEKNYQKGSRSSERLWLRLPLEDILQSNMLLNLDLYLYLPSQLIKEINIFYASRELGWIGLKSGFNIPVGSRDVIDDRNIFRLRNIDAESKYVYFSLNSLGLLNYSDFEIRTEDSFLTESISHSVIQSAIYTVMLALMFVIFLSYSAYRTLPFFLYAVYFLIAVLLVLVFDGIPYRYLWASSLEINRSAVFSLLVSLFLLRLVYSVNSLSVQKNQEKAFVLYRWVVSISACSIFSLIALNDVLWQSYLFFFSLFVLVIMNIVVCVGAISRRIQYSKLSMLAYCSMVSGVILFAVQRIGYLETFVTPSFCFLIGVILEMIVLSYILSMKNQNIRRQRREYYSDRLAAYVQSDRLKNEFLTNVSHELRTPLNGVQGILQLMQNEVLSRKEIDSYVNKALVVTDDLNVMLKSILQLSEAQSGLLVAKEIHFNICECIEGLIRNYRQRCHQKGLKLEAEISPSVPPVIFGDVEKIKSVVGQLFNNAVKFTSDGGIVIGVDWLASDLEGQNNGMLRISVSDTGIGISDCEQQNIFEMFSQLDTGVRKRFGGLGIGLSYSQQLVNIVNAELTVRSRRGYGSVFELAVPVKVGSAELVLPNVEDDTSLAGVLNETVQNILVVEDNGTNILVLEGMLRKLGYNVLSVVNGKDALSVLSQIDVNLVLMDCQMPIMDGLTATGKIREDLKSNVPIIAVTANATELDRERCIAVGMNDYIQKPIKFDLITKTLQKWVAA